MRISLLLIGVLITMLITSITASLYSGIIAYAHTFSENENALFLTLVHQIEAQTLLAQNNIRTNSKLAEQHANNAISLINQNDPVVNLTWASQISESNPRIAAQLTSVLNSIKNATSTSTAADPTNDIKTKVDRISGLLGEAVSSRLSRTVLNNSTTQALVLANIANEVYFSYGRAFGESSSSISNTVGMAMSVKEASSYSTMNMSSTSTSHDVNMGNNTGMSPSMAMGNSNSSSNNNAIKNITEYQTAQALANIAKDVFNKNLKTKAPTALKAANTEIENDLNQLNAAIDNKAPFMNIMKIVHIQLHPTLITAYHLQLQSFQ
jgi:hypothetical protein